MGRIARSVGAVATCLVVASGCSGSARSGDGASPVSSVAAATADEVAWPDDYGEHEEGHWTTGPLTTRDIVRRARIQEASIPCVRDFIGAIGFDHTIEWHLYLREGLWVLQGEVDGRPAEGFDRGSYAMWHIEGDLARFTEAYNDFWVYPNFHDPDRFTMNLVDVRRLVRDGDPDCFIEAAGIVQLTNTFERVE